jgi:hypothetical protein
MNDRIPADIPTCRMFEIGGGNQTVHATGDIAGFTNRGAGRAGRRNIREVVETLAAVLAVHNR